MKKVFLYAHGGSANHGCEAIVRSTADMLCGNEITLLTCRPEEDRKYGLDSICTLVKDRSAHLKKNSLSFLSAYMALKLRKDYIPMDKLWYKEAFSQIHKGDLALSIGGDNYCYADVEKYTILHDMIKKRGAKTVLWGCSVEPDVAARAEIAADLARYDLIAARESITYSALRRINPNTVQMPDPAFRLQSKQVELPKGFLPGKSVGLNLSPMAVERELVPGIAFANCKMLIEHILENTDMQIALIPHVVWDDGDDRIPLRRLYDEFADTGRVIMIDDHDCQALKYIISKCDFFVGARTHATIAAYSSCVPTLVVGYSVKARGIARDLFGTEDGYVLPVQQLRAVNELTDAFDRLYSRRDEIRAHLENTLPGYIAEAQNIHKLLEDIASS